MRQAIADTQRGSSPLVRGIQLRSHSTGVSGCRPAGFHVSSHNGPRLILFWCVSLVGTETKTVAPWSGCTSSRCSRSLVLRRSNQRLATRAAELGLEGRTDHSIAVPLRPLARCPRPAGFGCPRRHPGARRRRSGSQGRGAVRQGCRGPCEPRRAGSRPWRPSRRCGRRVRPGVAFSWSPILFIRPPRLVSMAVIRWSSPLIRLFVNTV